MYTVVEICIEITMEIFSIAGIRYVTMQKGEKRPHAKALLCKKVRSVPMRKYLVQKGEKRPRKEIEDGGVQDRI